MRSKIELGSMYFDVTRKLFCTVGELNKINKTEHVMYARLDYDDYLLKSLHLNSLYTSEYTLCNVEMFIPVSNEKEKLLIQLKYSGE